jgi:hypothetical protein
MGRSLALLSLGLYHVCRNRSLATPRWGHEGMFDAIDIELVVGVRVPQWWATGSLFLYVVRDLVPVFDRGPPASRHDLEVATQNLKRSPSEVLGRDLRVS